MANLKKRTFRKSSKVAKKAKSVKKKESVFSDILSQTIEDGSNASEKMLINKHPTELSPEQIIFCLEYINCKYVAAEAVRNTFAADDWPDAKVSKIGRDLLQLQKIKNYVQQELNNRCETLRVSADWAARKLKAWTEIDVGSYLEVNYVRTGKGRGVRAQIRLKTKLENLPKEVRCAIKGISVSTQGDLKVDFIDPKGAMDSLMKLLGLTENKLTIDNKAPINIFLDEQDAEA